MSTTTMSALRVTAAVAALATGATGAVLASGPGAQAAAGATAATFSVRAATSISIRVAHPGERVGRSDTVLGDLHVQGDPDAQGRTVTLEARPKGETSFTPVGTDTAGPHGGLSLKVSPEVTTHYRWHYFGADDAQPRTSGTATVAVRTSVHHASRLATSLSIRAVHRLVDAHGSDVVRGRLRSHHTGLPNRWVVLLLHPAGSEGWRFAAAHRTARGGAISFTVHPKGTTAYRLQFPGTQVFRPSHSGVVRVGVRPSVTIAASPRRLDHGQSTTVSGTVTDAGAPLAGATVDLLARTARPHTTFHQVGSAVTDSTGAVSLVDTPTVPTAYRLKVERTATTPAGLSKAVAVTFRPASSLSIRGRDAGPAHFVVGGTLHAQHHAVRRAVVTLLSQAPGATTWTQVAGHRTGRHGGVSFVEASAPGTGYRLAYAGGKFAPSTSGTVTD